MTDKFISQPDRPQENSLQDWKKADARILGQILAAQNVVFTLPDTARIAEFYAQALLTIPGITACRVCLGGKSALAGEMASGACAECETLSHLSWEAGTLLPTDSGFKCNLADQSGMQVIAIDADRHRFGFFVLQINQANLSGLYHPFVRNLAGYVALMLENRWQKKLLQKANDELERKVEERTHELIAANEALAASRGAALEMMKTAVEARQRSEQASADLEREVAEHKRLEREYRTLVETVPDFIVRYDLDLQRVYVNPAWEKASGLSAAQVVGVAHKDIPKVPSPVVDEYVHALRRVMQTGDSQTTEFSWENATGETLLLEYRIVPEYDRLGRIAGVLAVGRDITEHKRAQEKLEKERALLRCLIDSASDLIFIKDQDSIYRACNKASEAFLGMPEREQIGKTDFDFFDVKKAEEIRKTDRRVFDEGKSLHIEEWVTDRDGRRLLMDTVKTPYYDPEGKPLGLVGIGRDLTERKLLEQDRLAHLRFLEAMDKVNRAIQGADDLEKMMKDLLDNVLSVLKCDRAVLVYPCDPETSTWSAPMERTRPEYPAILELGMELPSDPYVATIFKILLNSDGPVRFDPESEHSLPPYTAEKLYSIRSFLGMAIYPKVGKPWQFGIHQCSHSRVWKPEELRLFKEIGRRLEDGLTSMLMHRNLRDSEERYRLVFENSPVSIWEEDFSGVKDFFDKLKKQGITDIETFFVQHPETVRQCAELARIVDVNQAALMLHAASSKNELLSSLANTFTLESFDTFRQALICLWNGCTVMSSDAVVRTLTNDVRNVTVSFSVCPGYEKTLSKVLVSLTDITGRKRIEEALRSSEAELRTLIEAMTDIIFVGNSEGRYLKIVDSSPSLLYKPPNELLGKTLHEVFPKDRADFFLNHIRQTLETQKSVNLEYSLPLGDRQFWFNATISPMSDDKFVMVARDITDHKQSEEKLAMYREHLEELVQERTAQLEAANQELEAFAYSVSHDLRAPLRHIDGFVELLQKSAGTALDEQSRHYMDTIADSAKRMGLLIDDLLSFSRMGRQALSFQQVDLGLLVRDVIRELEPDTAGRTTDWRVGDLPAVEGDGAMLRIVLVNLMSNALKFTRPRQQARIEIGSQPSQTPEAVIFVSDNGVGFDMAYADRLFGVFQRLHRADAFEGTGIGLASVRRIIARHGGRTWADGKVDQGATFYFSLPHDLQGGGNERT